MKKGITVMLLGLVLISYASGVMADGFHVGPYSQDFFEYYQRALIAWKNGVEYMYLEVGFSPRYGHNEANGTKSMLHVIPFPSLPKIQSANKALFKRVINLLEEKEKQMNIFKESYANPLFGVVGSGASGITPESAVKIGAHTIGVFRINTTKGLKDVVEQTFISEGVNFTWNITGEDMDVVNYYLSRGYNYFAFDSVNLTNRDQAKQPILYIFNTTNVYYPLRITTISNRDLGMRSIVLYIITQSGNCEAERPVINRFEKISYDAPLTQEELKKIDPALGEFIHRGYADVYTVTYISSKVADDFVLKVGERANSDYEYFVMGGIFLFFILLPLLIYYFNPRKEKKGIRTAILVAAMICVGLSILLIWIVFMYYSMAQGYLGIHSYLNSMGKLREYWFLTMEIIFAFISGIFSVALISKKRRDYLAYALFASLLGIVLLLQNMYLISQINALFYVSILITYLIILLPKPITIVYDSDKAHTFSLTAASLLMSFSLFFFYIIQEIIIMLVFYAYLVINLESLRSKLKINGKENPSKTQVFFIGATATLFVVGLSLILLITATAMGIYSPTLIYTLFIISFGIPAYIIFMALTTDGIIHAE